MLLKATKVDGIYTADPKKDKNAKLYDEITYQQVHRDQLRVMDLTAITLAMERKLPVVVFNLKTPGNIARVCAARRSGRRSRREDRVSGFGLGHRRDAPNTGSNRQGREGREGAEGLLYGPPLCGVAIGRTLLSQGRDSSQAHHKAHHAHEGQLTTARSSRSTR